MTAVEALRLVRTIHPRSRMVDGRTFAIPAKWLDAHAMASLLDALPVGTTIAPAVGCGEWHIRFRRAPTATSPVAPERVGSKLDEQRRFVGWSVGELAERAALAEETARRALKGHDTLCSSLFAIIAALDLTFADFLEMCDE